MYGAMQPVWLQHRQSAVPELVEGTAAVCSTERCDRCCLGPRPRRWWWACVVQCSLYGCNIGSRRYLSLSKAPPTPYLAGSGIPKTAETGELPVSVSIVAAMVSQPHMFILYNKGAWPLALPTCVPPWRRRCPRALCTCLRVGRSGRCGCGPQRRGLSLPKPPAWARGASAVRSACTR